MTRSVLMISGASFTDAAIRAQTRQLAKAGRYRFSAIGMDSSAGRPGDDGTEAFERTVAFPQRNLRPGELRARATLSWDALRCLTAWRAPWLDPGQVGDTGPATLEQRIRHRLRRMDWARAIPPLVQGHDLCHWHALTPQRLPALDFFPTTTPVVITIWGSDILRASGLETYRLQIRACERVDCITVNSLEMREILLSRLGRRFEGKIRFASFGSHLYDRIDEIRGKERKTLALPGLDSGKTVVCVGNNASPSNQHTTALASMGSLPESVRNRIAVVLPMSYGGDSDYRTQVRKAAAEAPFETHVIDMPLAEDEVAALRCVAAVLVHVPVTDAFSATMCEHLYGGSVLITGAWLPYGPLRRHGVHHHVIENLTQLGPRLARVLEHLEEERRRAAEGAAAVRTLAAWDSVAPQWLAIYDELTA